MDFYDIEKPDQTQNTSDFRNRPYVGVYFECCDVYTRIYRSVDGKKYTGFCPRCFRRIKMKVGPGGTSSRMFRAK
ncbi:MAG: hypothetical protein NUW37_02005 [Planctomycetes bacterium]|nr:hypothetical protein [Planctomycetota bacterium]